MQGLKRGGAAIVGVAESDLGQVADGLSVTDLMAQGTNRALDDCGLTLKDVDGLFCATAQSRLSVLSLAEYLGINPPFLGSTIVGGSSFEYHVAHAMAAIQQGLCNVCGHQSPLKGKKMCARCGREERRKYANRLQAGLCSYCGSQPAAEGRTMCAGCLEKSKARQKRRRQRLIKAHLCTRCGNRPVVSGKKMCAACGAVERSRSAKRAAAP